MTVAQAKDELVAIAVGEDIAAASRQGQRAERAKLRAAEAEAKALERKLTKEKRAAFRRELEPHRGAPLMERIKILYRVIRKYGLP